MAEIAAIIDTAPLPAALSGANRSLGRGARRLWRRAEVGTARLGVPTVCLFEIAQLEERGRVSLEVAFDRWCDLVDDSPSLSLVPLQRSHIVEARPLPLLRAPSIG